MDEEIKSITQQISDLSILDRLRDAQKSQTSKSSDVMLREFDYPYPTDVPEYQSFGANIFNSDNILTGEKFVVEVTNSDQAGMNPFIHSKNKNS
jgi:hypothetical protein